MIRLNSDQLKMTMKKCMINTGICEDSVNHVCDSVVQTSLRGVDSHGINLFPHYYNAANAGRINKNPNISINKTAPSTAILDADHALGHHSGAVAMDEAIKTAKDTGVSAVSVKNSTHFGAAAYFGLRAANNGCLGFAFTNADALVEAYGAKEKFFGTNPICFTAPLEEEEPFCLDMATSLVSWNKIKNYRNQDKSLPEHWAFNSEGQSVTDPHEAASLSPIGGYKGFGLGAMIDILCAFLTNNPSSKELAPMFTTPLEQKRNVSHFFMAINLENFIELNAFKKRLQLMVNQIRNLEPENTEVMIPGDPEKKNYQERIKIGIPIHENIFEEFLKISKEFNEVIL